LALRLSEARAGFDELSVNAAQAVAAQHCYDRPASGRKAAPNFVVTGRLRKNTARQKKDRGTNSDAREYLVICNGARWDVQIGGKATGSFVGTVDAAVGLAAADAQRDSHKGLEASVRVEEQGGAEGVAAGMGLAARQSG
jgi:hypothetical protein